jgi:hypothetical protein
MPLQRSSEEALCCRQILIFQNPLRFCRIWHHSVRLFSLRLVAEVSQGRSLHLS